MVTVIKPMIAILASYCLGSFSSAIMVCRLMGLPDPRSQGSTNPGATNVLRYGGKKAAVLTLAGDMAKGIIPVFVAKYDGFSVITLSLVVLAAFLGHLYPVFFKFQGGKGVATAAGCLLALYWPLGLVLLLTWLIIAILFRYSSLAALVTTVLAPVYTWYLTNSTYTVTVCIMSILLIYRHWHNIKNLISGQERKIGAHRL